tara:strand:+ start:362 stop:556 length:195 start_codon:yes stop_codon:yes gene_type:complete
MYYKENVLKLGEEKAVVYANKYINWLQLGCRYTDQQDVNKLCPHYLKEEFIVPGFFINMIKDID